MHSEHPQIEQQCMLRLASLVPRTAQDLLKYSTPDLIRGNRSLGVYIQVGLNTM